MVPDSTGSLRKVTNAACDLPLPPGPLLWLVSGLQLLFMGSRVHFAPGPVVFTGNVQSVLDDQRVVGPQPHVLCHLQKAAGRGGLLLSDVSFLKQVLAC